MVTANGLKTSGKLKLLYILDAFPDPQAGTEGQFWLLFNQLDRSRVDPAVVLLRPSGFLTNQITDAEVKVLNVHRLRSFRSVWRILSLVRWARRAGFEVVHIFFNDSALVFPLPLAIAGLRVIVSRRDLGFWHTRSNLPLLRFNTRFVDAVVANCEAVKAVVVDQEGYAPGKIRVIYNGIRRSTAAAATDVRGQLGIPQNSPIVAIVANLRPLKRIADLIRALVRVQCIGVPPHLLVIGEDRNNASGTSHRDELMELARSLNVAARVHFTGKIEDPMPLLVSATVCALVSETEGLSNSVIEYMLAGKPVVCTDAGGNGELVQDGQNGFVVPVGDVGAIANSISRLLDDRELAERMAQYSAQRANDLFRPERMLDAHMDLYCGLRRA